MDALKCAVIPTAGERKVGQTRMRGQAGRQAGRVSSVTSNARALSVLPCKAKAVRRVRDTSPPPGVKTNSGHTTVSGNMYVMMSRSRRASPKPPKALQECVCSGAGPPGGSRLAPAREGRKRHEHAKRRLVSRFGLVRGGGGCMELVAFAASFYCDPVVYRARNASSSSSWCNA